MGAGISRLLLGGKRNLGLVPHELGYFNAHFNGEPMPSDWTPPPAEIDGKSKKAADFISWMRGAPVVSKKAMDALLPIVGASVQFLPFHAIKGKAYFAMNVVAIERALLDAARSDIVYGPVEPRRPLTLKKAVFHAGVVPATPVFKAALQGHVFADVFVTLSFAQAVVIHALTGAALADPASDPMRFALAQKSPNVVLGVPEW
jgi:hypothetical protein